MDVPQFGKDILDFNRLLEGENRLSTYAEDAQHWAAVYTDLVGFKERMLSEIRQHIEKVPETGIELGGYDIPFLEAELGRLRSGKAFWEARLDGTGS